MIRILLVDDHPVVRDGLAAMLSTQPDFSIIGTAGSGSQAVSMNATLQPDVILLDLEMPDMDGVEALDGMKKDRPDVKVIVFTAFDTDERIMGALRAGAQGYLLKGAPRDELFRALRVVHEGGSLLQPVVTSKLLDHFRATARPGESPGMVSLTAREQEILRLVGQGMRNRDIALKLMISERTVKFHVSSILAKMGAKSRTDAVRLAVQQGLIEI